MSNDKVNASHRPATVVIRFGKSTSANYDEAARIAARILCSHDDGELAPTEDHYVECSPALDDAATWRKINRLVELVSGWKSATISVCGSDDWRRALSDIEEIRRCYTRCLQSHDVDWHCSRRETPGEPLAFGCVHARGVSPGNYERGHSGPPWWRFGHLADDLSKFHVDKDTILQRMRSASEQATCSLCPHFTMDRVERDVLDLPDEIELDASSKFEIVYSERDPTNAVGVRYDPYRSTVALSLTGQETDEEELVPDTGRQVPDQSYDDIGGLPSVIDEIRTMIQLPLQHPEYFEQVGVKPQRGVLLYGSPGNGKTMLARAAAGQSSSHFELINGPAVKSKWVGQSEENLRDAFSRAKRYAPSIVLIDELDSIAPRREEMDHQHDVSLISQLLVLLDGVEDRGEVIVVATTNRFEAIDPAVLRPGRFDYHILIPLPDRAGRADILRKHLARVRIAASVSLEHIAEKTPGFSGADLAGLCREAGLLAIKQAVAAGVPPSEVEVTDFHLQSAASVVAKKRRRQE